MINIAIDGPSGAGKSTVARRLAVQLGYIYVDTGALYRAIAYHMLEQGVDTADTDAIAGAMEHIASGDITLRHIDSEQRVFAFEQDVSDRIRTPEVSMAASAVSAVPAVREALLHLQQDMARMNNVVMDGRDIGTVVLPHAAVKIFLTAKPEERARRRYEELMAKGQQVHYEDVLREVKQRDYNDSHREIAPLKPAPDSITVDTTGNTLEKSVRVLTRTVVRKLRRRPITPYLVVGRKLLLWLIWLFLPVRVHHKERIPLGGGLIICANHTTLLDPVILGVAFRRQLHYMAKEELFKNKLFGGFLRALGAFPVSRGTGGQAGIERAVEVVNQGRVVGIFPEGTRSKDNTPQRAKAGTSVVARVTGGDVLPVAICCKKGHPRLFRRIDVIVGEVIPNPDLNLGEPYTYPSGMADSRGLKTAANFIMEDITRLWQEGNKRIGRKE